MPSSPLRSISPWLDKYSIPQTKTFNCHIRPMLPPKSLESSYQIAIYDIIVRNQYLDLINP